MPITFVLLIIPSSCANQAVATTAFRVPSSATFAYMGRLKNRFLFNVRRPIKVTNRINANAPTIYRTRFSAV